MVLQLSPDPSGNYSSPGTKLHRLGHEKQGSNLGPLGVRG